MANDKIDLYNFYRRYRWTAADFTGWQTGMVDHSRGMFEGLLNSAVLEGFGYQTTPSSLDLTVSQGIASGPSGYLHVLNEVTNISFDAPSSGARRDLVVVRPKLVDNTPITNPTNPYELVPLKTSQESEVVVIEGTEGDSPVYPSKEVNDVILFGLFIESTSTELLDSNFDLEIRDLIGKNSLFQQDAGKFDDRLRPYKVNEHVLGIKPSQLEPPNARVFSYVNKTGPSIFPKNSAGEYNPQDTFIDLSNGMITGGDEQSVLFGAIIPNPGMFVVGCISLYPTDLLVISYGDIAGTREQAFEAIRNQRTTGAAAVNITPGAKPIAFVVVGSTDGVEIDKMDFFDCRGLYGVGESSSGLAGGGVVLPSLSDFTIDEGYNGAVIFITPSTFSISSHSNPSVGFKFTIKDNEGLLDPQQASINPFANRRVRFRPNGSQLIEGLNQDYNMYVPFGCWSFIFDGTNWSLIP